MACRPYGRQHRKDVGDLLRVGKRTVGQVWPYFRLVTMWRAVVVSTQCRKCGSTDTCGGEALLERREGNDQDGDTQPPVHGPQVAARVGG